MTAKVAIGSKCIVRHSMFEARDAAGGYRQAMPPMTRDAEQLQAVLLARPVKRGNGWLWTCAAAVGVLLVMVSV